MGDTGDDEVTMMVIVFADGRKRVLLVMIECLVVQVIGIGLTIVVVGVVSVVLVGLVAISLVIICCGNHKNVARVSCEMPMVFDWLWRIKELSTA